MAHQCAAISHTWCKRAVAESSSATAVIPVPNLRSQTPTHHQVFWLMQPGAAEDLPKTPRAASYLLMGSRPQWPPFGAKPHNCKYSYGVSPGLSPGSFYPRATQRSSARRVIQCIIFLFTIYHIYRTLSTFFSHPTTKDTAAAGASPQAAAARAFYPMLRYFTSMRWISAS